VHSNQNLLVGGRLSVNHKYKVGDIVSLGVVPSDYRVTRLSNGQPGDESPWYEITSLDEDIIELYPETCLIFVSTQELEPLSWWEDITNDD